MNEWKKVKLGNCIEEINDRSTKNNQYEVLTSSKSGIYSQEEYFDKQVASKDNTGYKIIKKGQFTYRSMSDNGTFTINKLENKEIGIVSPAYPVFEASDINAEYLKYFFQSEEFRKAIYNLAQGSTRIALKYKDLSNIEILLPPIKEQEKIIASLVLKDKNKNVTLFTKNGLTKQVALKDFEVTRYSKPMTAIKLKDNDELINADISKEEVLFVTNNGLALRFNTNEIPVVGSKASGVKGINLKDDYCIYASPINKEEYLNIYTNYKTIKRLKLSDITPISRAKKGNMLFKKAKTKDYKILFAYLTETKDVNLYKIDTDIHELKNSEIPIMDLASTGSQVKYNYDLFTLKKELIDLTKDSKEDPKEEVLEINQKPSKKEEQLSFASFIDDFKI